MTIILANYLAIAILWATLFYVHQRAPLVWKQANKATWWLLVSSAVVIVAWFMNSILISLLGSVLALTSVSFIFQVITDWLRKKKVSRIGQVIWFEWFFVFSLTIAHLFVLVYNYLNEIAR